MFIFKRCGTLVVIPLATSNTGARILESYNRTAKHPYNWNAKILR